MHILVSVIIIVSVMAYFFYASYSIRACIYMRVFCCKKTEEKIIAITFDDGPDPIQTPKVLKVLREKHIPACFLPAGFAPENFLYPTYCPTFTVAAVIGIELLRQIIKEGHRIGNHSFSHSGYFPLYTFKRMCHDLITCQQELEKVTGQPVLWFRPPFGVTNPTLAKAVRRLGYIPIGWNIRTLDTQQPTPEKIIKRIKKRLVPGSILLLHDRMPDSDRLLVQVLDFIEKEGYTVVTLDRLIKDMTK